IRAATTHYADEQQPWRPVLVGALDAAITLTAALLAFAGLLTATAGLVAEPNRRAPHPASSAISPPDRSACEAATQTAYLWRHGLVGASSAPAPARRVDCCGG